MFFPFSSLFFFLGRSKSSFFASIVSRFLSKLLRKKMFWCRFGGVLHWALFFSCLFFHCFFIFYFSIFPCFFFLFLLFSFKKCFFLFHFVSLFSFLGAQKSVAALQDSLEKCAHSELALFAVYWLVVTFPCGSVHILVMIRLRVENGGVKSYLSYQCPR